MYARVSTLESPPELIDEGLRQAREVVLPQGEAFGRLQRHDRPG